MTSQERATAVVVNDDPSQLTLASRILERDGWLKVFTCKSAGEALVLMQEQGPPDLVITDLHMPGIDGWRFCRLLRSPECAALNQVPILVVSATYSGADLRHVTANLGANAFLPVPYHRSALLRHVSEILAGRAPRASKTAMIVSDDPAQVVGLERALTRHGYTCWVAKSDEDGRRLLDETKPDIAVLCIRHPDQSREKLLEETKKPGSSTIAILIIADQIAIRAIELLEKGADGFLRDPFEAEDMIALCEQALRERSLMRVEEVLEERTQELRKSEIKHRLLLARIPHLAQTSDAVNRQLSCFSSRYMNLLAVFQI